MMNTHTKCLNVTRVIVAVLFMVAIWAAPSILSNVCASIGTVMWLFMPHVVRIEETLLAKVKKNG